MARRLSFVGTRRLWRIVAVATGVAITLAVTVVASVVPFSSETARRELIDALADGLDAEVELDALEMRVLPRLRADGRGLTIRHKGRRDIRPLISVRHFTAEGSVLSVVRRHISRVVLDGLDIEIPPHRTDDAELRQADAGPAIGPRDIVRAFVIDDLESNDARLVVFPRKPGKRERVWNIHRLRLSSVAFDRSMPFAATLTNAVPPGEIETTGSFGPWNSRRPGGTPLEGAFTLAGADLGVFEGIAGLLSARGTYGGVLERIDIQGETETPVFTITSVGHPIALTTTYRAIVDGTNGDTILERIDASFLRTALVAKGMVIDAPGKEGRTVTLEVTATRARLEDVLRLAVNTERPPMVGALRLATRFVLPPGQRDVVRKLRLDGRFAIGGTRFTGAETQDKINALSHRTRGHRDDHTTEPVSSHFDGTFRLSDGILTIPSVRFDVPGSMIELSGHYALEHETLDFRGTAYTDAKVSQMTTGFKSLLLKPVDLLLRRDRRGTAIPITITGTREEPSFGLDKGRAFSRK